MPKPSRRSLPNERDFDPWKGDLDAQCAWRHFGGLTLDEARATFRENPLGYQEDFMFMGPVAFAFYFPVIEDHLRSDLEPDPYDDHQGWILAHGIKAQYERTPDEAVRHLIPRVRSLVAYVCENIQRFGVDADKQQRVADAWLMLATHLDRIAGSTGQGEQGVRASPR